MTRGWTTYATVLAPPHDPLRPSWLCAQDGQAWPCDVARAQLAAEHGDALAAVLAEQLVLAAREMPNARPADLHKRFVAWT
ncbi:MULTISPECIES: flavin reductase [Catenuloplanes]|uniref:Uncharacterized protein n=1 Tax=Catenuloplanes niger TaxID=587534 RepID=A0AAE3ZNW1_9ACTN|nr:flavin reductase [Catenuloplanes niger]MDR7323359.1 hypothetical protein [Catenuloplanes niger]